MSQATSVFWVSIYEHYGAFERKEIHIVSELKCHVWFSLCAAKNVVYSSATVKQHKQQAAFLPGGRSKHHTKSSQTADIA